jgi:hypothetical protein
MAYLNFKPFAKLAAIPLNSAVNKKAIINAITMYKIILFNLKSRLPLIRFRRIARVIPINITFQNSGDIPSIYKFSGVQYEKLY